MNDLCKRIAAIAPKEWGLTFGDGLDNDKNVLWNTDGPVVVYFFADLGDAPANHCSTVRILEWLNKTDRSFGLNAEWDGRWQVSNWHEGDPAVDRFEVVRTLAEASLYGLLWWLEAGERA